MTYLTPSSDRIVRSAVDDYLNGRRRLQLPCEAVLETRNSRYRFDDGRVVQSTDDALMGAELVGWLEEDDEGAVQTSAEWRPGLRAILVDHQNHRHIVVTSQTRTFADARMVQTGSPSPQPPGSPLPRFESSPSYPDLYPPTPGPRVVVSEPTPQTKITNQPPAIPALPPAPALTPTPQPVSVHAQALAARPVGGRHPKTRSLPPLALARPLPPPSHPPTRGSTPAPVIDRPLPSFAVESSDRMPLRDVDLEDADLEEVSAPNIEDDVDDLAETNARPAARPQSSRPPTRRRPPPPPRRRMARAPHTTASS